MNNNICTVLDRSDKVRCAERVVDNNGNTVLVCKSRNSVDIGNVAVGVAERFNEYRLCIRLNSRLNLVKVVNVNKRGRNSVLRECVGKEIEASAVDRFLSYNMVAVLSQSLNCVCYRCRTRSYCKSRNAALKSGNSFFKNVLSGVCKSAVNVARIGKSEASRRMSGIVENV